MECSNFRRDRYNADSLLCLIAVALLMLGSEKLLTRSLLYLTTRIFHFPTRVCAVVRVGDIDTINVPTERESR